jgi:hypothetical protein
VASEMGVIDIDGHAPCLPRARRRNML